ncbi:MAG: hypothetical protein JWO72_726 [Caulobacteraceae bacterium]|jgi:hypothetical protein|nr:hypothetical protein [Caulobacteraceae bacterium]
MLSGGAVLLSAGAAAAENWFPFFVIPNGVVYLDHDSVVRRSGHVSARLESTFPAPQRISRNGQVFAYVKTIDLVDIDCKAEVYKNVSRDLYTGDGAMALSINESDNPLRIPPKSAQAALITAYCG